MSALKPQSTKLARTTGQPTSQNDMSERFWALLPLDEQRWENDIGRFHSAKRPHQSYRLIRR